MDAGRLCRGDGNERRVGDEPQPMANATADLLLRPRILDQVPLVQGHGQSPAGIGDRAGDVLVLIGHALCGVEHQDGHIRPLDGHARAAHAVALNRAVHARGAAEARRIHEDKRSAAKLQVGVHGVPRRPG